MARASTCYGGENRRMMSRGINLEILARHRDVRGRTRTPSKTTYQKIQKRVG